MTCTFEPPEVRGEVAGFRPQELLHFDIGSYGFVQQAEERLFTEFGRG